MTKEPYNSLTKGDEVENKWQTALLTKIRV